jgi:hypothetical protein
LLFASLIKIADRQVHLIGGLVGRE